MGTKGPLWYSRKVGKFSICRRLNFTTLALLISKETGLILSDSMVFHFYRMLSKGALSFHSLTVGIVKKLDHHLSFDPLRHCGFPFVTLFVLNGEVSFEE